MKKPPPGPDPGEGNGTTHTKEGSAVKQSNPPREVTLPTVATAHVRHVNGRDQIVLTAPDGTDTILRFEDAHPGDVCVTLTSLIGAARAAEGRYFDRELALDYEAVAS